MNKICTSIEQSQKLIELGIDVNTADMCYRIVAYNPNDTHVYQPYCFVGTLESDIPAWSLDALLGALPKGTRLLKSATDDTYHCDCPKGNVDKWFDNSIDAAFVMVCWLKENNKI